MTQFATHKTQIRNLSTTLPQKREFQGKLMHHHLTAIDKIAGWADAVLEDPADEAALIEATIHTVMRGLDTSTDLVHYIVKEGNRRRNKVKRCPKIECPCADCVNAAIARAHKKQRRTATKER